MMNSSMRRYISALTEDKLMNILKKYSLDSVFVIHGVNSYKICGAEQVFSSVFKKLSISVVHFSQFTENPLWSDIQIGIETCRKLKPSLIIGIGGGSALDTAKLIRFFCSYTGTPFSFSQEKELIPLILFPTTAGSGAEATHFAVCYIDSIKYSVANEAMLPTDYYIDPAFTYSSSPYLTACTGFDAFAHAVESYWSINSTVESRRYAKQALEYIYPNLISCIYNPTKSLRKKLAYGAHLAGKAINISFTTAAHAYSYGITTGLGIPHGHAVAYTFAYFFELNSGVSEKNCCDVRGVDFVKKRMIELCTLLSLKEEDCFLKLTDYINNVFQCNQAWRKPTEEEMTKIFSSVNMERLRNNPVSVETPPPRNKMHRFS